MIQVVTALVLQGGGGLSHSREMYQNGLRALWSNLPANCGLTLFLDRALHSILDAGMCGIQVIPTSVEELPSSITTLTSQNPSLILGENGNPEKDTLDYFLIQNSKPWWVLEALKCNPNATHAAWIDAGAARLFSSPTLFYKLGNVDKLSAGLHIPGCVPKRVMGTGRDGMQWRFCGTFFCGDSLSLERFAAASLLTFVRRLPYVAWEVVTWARMEQDGFPFVWYKGDHNDTLFDCLSSSE